MRERLIRLLSLPGAKAAGPAAKESAAARALRVRWKSTEVNNALRWLDKDAYRILAADLEAPPADLAHLAWRVGRFCAALSGYMAVMEREIAILFRDGADAAGQTASAVGACREFERLGAEVIRPFVLRYHPDRCTEAWAGSLRADMEVVAAGWGHLCRLERAIFGARSDEDAPRGAAV